jgi:hypothetical protein
MMYVKYPLSLRHVEDLRGSISATRLSGSGDEVCGKLAAAGAEAD